MLITSGNDFFGIRETTGMRILQRLINFTGVFCFVSIICMACCGIEYPAAWGHDAKSEVDHWESEIRKFEELDQKLPPPVGANVFVGSSSVRLWKLDASFPKSVCINRGFGGSQMGDSARYVDRIVINYKPRVVVLYAGDNDIAGGKTPTMVRDDYRVFRSKIQKTLPEARIVLISLKPSPSRWKLREQAQEANRLLREEVIAGTNQVFVDVWTPMLGDDGMPRAELFVKDNLHMNDAGYKVWNQLIATHLHPAKE